MEVIYPWSLELLEIFSTIFYSIPLNEIIFCLSFFEPNQNWNLVFAQWWKPNFFLFIRPGWASVLECGNIICVM